MTKLKLLHILLFGCCIPLWSLAQDSLSPVLTSRIDKEVVRMMDQGGIPGLSMVIVDSGREIIKSYGWADVAESRPVTAHTLFQLGSCSKAFTALAIMQLAQQRRLDLDSPVTSYIPWFRAYYRDRPVSIPLRDLLHHTAGIPWQTIASIPEANDAGALERTIRGLSGIRLRNAPGEQYEYATIDYDLLALVVQQVTGQPFETYVQTAVLEPLGLQHTTIGGPRDSALLATGYKIGFFRPRSYAAPVYRGNDAAGYVISDAGDMARWLRIQMGQGDTAIAGLVKATQRRDETVALHGMASYAMGWQVSLSGNGQIYHSGSNPNYTAYVGFRPARQAGVVLLANSNSNSTQLLGLRIMQLLSGEKFTKEPQPGDFGDRGYAISSLILALFILGAGAYIGIIIAAIGRGRRKYRRPTPSRMGRFLLSVLLAAPFLYGLYLLPQAMLGFSWRPFLVWSPVSAEYLVGMILAAMVISYLARFIGLLFPEPDKIRNAAPGVLLLSVLSGIANMVMIILVTSAINSTVRLRYQLFYFFLALGIFLLGRRSVQVSLIRVSRGLINDLKLELIGKIFSTCYQHFEKMDRGRVYTALNGDVETLGGAADQFIGLITNAFTVAGIFLYLATIAFWTALMTIGLIIAIALLYSFVSRKARKYFEQARDTQNVYMRLINSMIDGFKEISLHRQKKREYKAEIAQVANEYRDKITIAGIRFANAFMIGDSLLVLLLGVVVFLLPRLFPDLQSYTIMDFVIVLLYLIGPVNGILGAIPAIMQLRIAWRRVQGFLQEIPATLSLDAQTAAVPAMVRTLRLEGLVYRYKNGAQHESFAVGPIDLEACAGEVLFICGGNGSGKTTLAKLITGLYEPDGGRVLIDEQPVSGAQLGEYYSATFAPPYLFERLYNIDVKQKQEQLSAYLKLLELDQKVTVADNRYNTIDLSGGQRKRLALLQCYLEDAPIYLFDEWAADQDPDFRNFFYRKLLPDMRAAGKIIIAITHDDHYFDVADKIIKMKQGQIEPQREDIPLFADEQA